MMKVIYRIPLVDRQDYPEALKVFAVLVALIWVLVMLGLVVWRVYSRESE